MSENQILNEMESLFLALADKTRLRLINLMREDEISVNVLMGILGESQPKVSRHLAYLRNAGIVEPRREGKQVFYRLTVPNDKSAAFILDDLLDWLKNQTQLQTEYSKLLRQLPDKKNTDKKFLKGNNNASEEDVYARSNISQKREELEIFLL